MEWFWIFWAVLFLLQWRKSGEALALFDESHALNKHLMEHVLRLERQNTHLVKLSQRLRGKIDGEA